MTTTFTPLAIGRRAPAAVGVRMPSAVPVRDLPITPDTLLEPAVRA